jgi:hypothetical protein
MEEDWEWDMWSDVGQGHDFNPALVLVAILISSGPRP